MLMPPQRFLVLSRMGRGSARDRAGPLLRAAKSPTTGGLEGSVYTLKNELSISFTGRASRPNPGSLAGKSPFEHGALSAQGLSSSPGQLTGR